MAKPLNVDWTAARAMYLQGYTLEQVAERLGIRPCTVKQRASRYQWRSDQVAITSGVTKAVTESAMAVAESATLSLQERAAKWCDKVAGVVEKHLDFVSRKSPDKLKLSEVETLTRILGNTDATARRTFGLDKPDASRQAAVGIKVNLRIDTAGGQAATPQAVDAEVVDEDSK